jgi:phytoene dehydrogenase-like protein
MSNPAPSVIVVGAGLAGLSAAVHLSAGGFRTTVLEASDGVGGRVRTDVVEGFRLDRGFQVFNTAYPEAARVLDYPSLDLADFTPGALVYLDGRRHRLVNPLRRPAGVAATLASPVGSMRQKVALGALAARDVAAPAGWLKTRPDTSTEAALGSFGLGGTITERFLRPFLSGVFLERELATSSRFFNLNLRMFAKGRLGVPADGMGAIPAQLAQRLAPEAIRLRHAVRHVDPGGVTLDDGTRLEAAAVIVATDPTTASRLLPTVADVGMWSVTTLYHVAPRSPLGETTLLLDGEEHLVVNSLVLTEAAPSYGLRDGRALISSSVLGVDHGPGLEAAVRARLGVLYGVDTAQWRHLASYSITHALPMMLPPLQLRRPVQIEPGLYVCGDHRDTSSIQGAMVSGRRAASALRAHLGR